MFTDLTPDSDLPEDVYRQVKDALDEARETLINSGYPNGDWIYVSKHDVYKALEMLTKFNSKGNEYE